VTDEFPKGRVLARCRLKTRETLGTLPMVIVTPVVAAVVSAAWASTHPAREVVRGNVVVSQTGFGQVLSSSVIGLLGGLGAVLVAVFAWQLVSYHRYGDPDWNVGWQWDDGGHLSRVFLEYGGDVSVGKLTLGHVEAELHRPDAPPMRIPYNLISPSTDALWFMAVPDKWHPPPPGTYEARWYGSSGKRKRWEVARAKRTLPLP